MTVGTEKESEDSNCSGMLGVSPAEKTAYGDRQLL